MEIVLFILLIASTKNHNIEIALIINSKFYQKKHAKE